MKLFSTREELRDLILHGNTWKALLLLGIPITLNNFLSTLFSAIDLHFLGKVGLKPIEAMGLLNNFLLGFLALGAGLGVGVVAIVGKEIGAGNFFKVRRLSAQVIIISELLSLLVAATLWLLSPSIMEWSGAKGEVYTLGVEYLRITALGFPFVFLTFVFNALNNAEGKTWVPFLFSFAIVVLNYILDPFFIFTLGLGMKGAAYVTVIAQGLQALIIVIIFANQKGEKKFRLSDFSFSWEAFKKLLEKSSIPALNQGINSFGFAIYFMTINSFGSLYLISVSTSNRIYSMMYMALIGISGAAVTIIAQNVGAHQIKKVFKVFRQANILTIIFSLLLMTLLMTQAEFFLRIFVQDADVIAFSKTYLNWFAPMIPLLGTFDVFMSLLLGFGFMGTMMALSIMRIFLLRIPSAWFLSTFFNMGPEAIYLGVTYSTIIAWIIAYIYYFFWFMPKYKKEKEIIPSLDNEE